MIRLLPRVVPAAPGRPQATEPPAIRQMTRQIAFDPDGWSPARAARVGTLFDGLAPEWHIRMADPMRTLPLADAYERGGIPVGGVCLEVGSGTGANTAFLAARHAVVVATDLSAAMLERAPAAPGLRLRADSSATPVRARSVDAAVLVNALLFPSEMDRVVADDGVLVWVNTHGDLTPIHLPAEDVERALPGHWDAVAGEAGWGTWAVFRRS